MRLLRHLVFLALLVVGLCLIRAHGSDGDRPLATPAPREQSSPTIQTTLHKAVSMLVVVPEDRRHYSRSLFGQDWADLDGDCQDTRAEVLARESLVPVANRCAVTRGTWLSYYDNRTWTSSFEVQIDHLVPLAEAWDSGAYGWAARTRLRYANDLGDSRTLVPITTAVNYAKLADDPASYLPAVNACRYVAAWVAVKLRWSLTADQREHEVISKVARGCPDVRLEVRKARQ